MPIFFQHTVNDNTRIGVWRIEEGEDFFKESVPLQREVSHPHKRLQHLAGRFLLRYLYPAFPYDLIRIADTRKPYLPNEDFHFSISHCGDYAAAIVSPTLRVGIDIESPQGKISRLKDKFTSEQERAVFQLSFAPDDIRLLTLIWSVKETIYKWYGEGGVDFREHIRLTGHDPDSQVITGLFIKNSTSFSVAYKWLDDLVLCWIVT